MNKQKQDQLGMTKQRSANGFTVAEMVFVVMIMAIIAATGLPMLTTSMNHYRLKGAAEEVVNAIQYAQSKVISSGRRTRVEVSASVDQISVRQYTISANLTSGGNQLAAGNVESGTYELMEYPLKRGSVYQIQFSTENRLRGVDITVSSFDSSTPVNFDTLGRPSHGGTVTLALGGQQMVVMLDALTGKVGVSN